MCYGLVLVLLLGAEAKQELPAAEDVAEYLQEISVTLKAGSAQGSGTMVIVEVDGKPRTFCWTAHHVIAGLREVKEVITPDGSKRQAVTFREPEIVQEYSEEGARVGETKVLAKVITCSEKEDLALLMVRKKGYAKKGAIFNDAAVPKVGTALWACGSPGGQEIGANSVTTGIVSQVGRRFPEFPGEFDQVSCQGLPGSSGCGIYLKDGKYTGLLTMGVRGADSFHYIVPMRRIKTWAEKMKIAWALGSGTAPTMAEIDKIPVEDTGTMFKVDKSKSTEVKPLPKFVVEPLTVTP